MTNRNIVKFGDICSEIKLTTKDPVADGYERYIGLEHLDSGSLKIKRWGITSEDNPSFNRVFKKGNILFGKRRPYLKKAAIAEFDGVCSGDIIVLESKKNTIISSGLLPFFIQSNAFWDIAVSTSSGSLSPRTKFSALSPKEFEIKRPDDSELFETILKNCHRSNEHLIQLQRAAGQVINSLYLSIFKNFYEKSESQVSVPDGWDTVLLGDLLLSKPESGYSANEVPVDTERYVLNLNNLSRYGFVSGDLKSISDSDFKKQLKLEEGDFLISRANTHELVGLAGIYTSSAEKVIFPDTMMRLKFDETMVKKEFVESYLLSPYGRRAIQRIAAGTSASMKKINKENLSKVRIPVPKDIKEQEGIVASIMGSRQIYQEIERQLSVRDVLRNNIVKEFIC